MASRGAGFRPPSRHGLGCPGDIRVEPHGVILTGAGEAIAHKPGLVDFSIPFPPPPALTKRREALLCHSSSVCLSSSSLVITIHHRARGWYLRASITRGGRARHGDVPGVGDGGEALALPASYRFDPWQSRGRPLAKGLTGTSGNPSADTHEITVTRPSARRVRRFALPMKPARRGPTRPQERASHARSPVPPGWRGGGRRGSQRSTDWIRLERRIPTRTGDGPTKPAHDPASSHRRLAPCEALSLLPPLESIPAATTTVGHRVAAALRCVPASDATPCAREAGRSEGSRDGAWPAPPATLRSHESLARPTDRLARCEAGRAC